MSDTIPAQYHGRLRPVPPARFPARARLSRGALAAPLLLAGAGLAAAPQASGDPPTVAAVAASSGQLVRQAATLVPYERVTVYARTTGYVNAVNVDIGDRVRTGQVLAVLDVPDVEAEVKAREAAVRTATARVEKARATRSLKDALFRLADDLFRKGGRTKLQLEESRAELEVAEAEEKLAEALEAEARARLDQIRVERSFAEVRAPFDGVVTARFVHTGALVHSGAEGDGRRLFDVQRLDKVRCLVNVPEADALLVLGSLREGRLSAQLSFDALAGKTLEFGGTELAEGVARFSRALHPESKHMTAAIDIDNGDASLLPGFFARVTFVARGDAAGDAVLVPHSAVRRGRKGERYVFVIGNGSGRTVAQVRAVQTGDTDGVVTEVLDGLRPGERVVVSEGGDLSAGKEVRVREAAPSGRGS